MKNSCSLFVVLVLTIYIQKCESMCENVNNEVNCKSVNEISSTIISELPNINKVTQIRIEFNSELAIYHDAFESCVKLQYILIGHNRINKIYPNTFKNLPVRYLNIAYNQINVINHNAFSNLSSLQKLRAEVNNLKEIPTGVFTNLPINELALSRNKISTIENMALANLPNLKKLMLDGNRLQFIYLHEVLTYPEELTTVWLHNNSLTVVTGYMLQRLENLEILNLAMNSIFFVEPNSFKQTPKLSYLILSYNHLKEINGNIFPKGETSSLRNLYIDNNRLMFFSFNFFVGLGKLKNIVIVGNPWYCSCLTVVQTLLEENGIVEKCDGEYSSGQRPICVSGNVDGNDCLHIYNDSLSDKYEIYKRNYPLTKQPLLCWF